MSFSAYWMYILAVLGGLIAGFRIWQNL